ncbi:MAG: valine--pyruvate transaminase [Arenicellales bacterium]
MKFSNFSRQFNPESGILQLMNDLGHAVNTETKLHMLGGGNPATIPAMEKVFRREMMALMSRGREFENMIGNYDTPQGNRMFAGALATMLQQNLGWPVTPSNIAITNGSQAGFGILFNLFSGAFPDGSFKKILLPMTPEYIGYADVGLGEQSIFTANQPLIEKRDELLFKYRVDFEHLEVNHDIGAVCISRPTNPTGNVVTDNELNKLRQLAANKGIPLILDGAYGLPFPGIIFTDATPVWDTNIILCLSLSKLGLPGTRAGIIIAAEPLIELISGSNAIFTLAPGRFGPGLITNIMASGEILHLCQNIVKPFYRNRSDNTIGLVDQLMSDLPVRIHVSEGAIFLWLWFEGLPISSEELYQRLKARGVLVIAGHHFFPGLDSSWQHRNECIRVSYAASETDVIKGIEIIADQVRIAYLKGASKVSNA